MKGKELGWRTRCGPGEDNHYGKGKRRNKRSRKIGKEVTGVRQKITQRWEELDELEKKNELNREGKRRRKEGKG